jgi:hypothetical protein
LRSDVVAKSPPLAARVVSPDGTRVQRSAVNPSAALIVMGFVREPGAPLLLECVKESRFPGFVPPDGTMSR